jgi:hypothetical protein
MNERRQFYFKSGEGMESINIDLIRVGKKRRELGDIDTLADSIASIGLINPISVTEDFQLIAGLHRLEACKSIGWMEIPAIILSLDEVSIQLAEIDENLIRNELNVLERGEQLKRRKDLYEAMYPETKAGVAGAIKSNKAQGNLTSADSAVASFVKDTAAKTSKSSRTISEDVQIANRISEPVRDSIRQTPLADSKSELLIMSRLDTPLQIQVAEKITNGAGTVKEALQEIAVETPTPEGFKSSAQVALEHKQSAGYKWNESLYKAVLMLNSIRDLGGILKLSEKWSNEHRAQYAERCREYAKTYTEYAEQLEGAIK